MKLRLIATFALLAAPAALSMEKPTLLQKLYQFTIGTPITKPMKTGSSYREVYKEVKAIVKNGSTVQEAETQRLREKKMQALQYFKNCAEISDENWSQITKELEQPNPLIKNPKKNNNHLQNQIDLLFDKLKNDSFQAIEDKHKIIEEITKLKLKMRNLNSKYVKIRFVKGYSKMHGCVAAVNHYSDKSAYINFDYKKIIAYPIDSLSGVIDHEITHLEENHVAQSAALTSKMHSNDPHSYCSIPINYSHEFDADSLYALTNLAAAHDANNTARFYSLTSWTSPSWSSTHPSDSDRYKQSRKIVEMLEIENACKPYYQNKARIAATQKRAFATFDPALNG